MYKCFECGNLFEEGEQYEWYETYGCDIPPYKKMSGCPVCHCDYDYAYQCLECGDWHHEDDLYCGLCDKCLDDRANKCQYDIEMCYKVGKNDLDGVEINGFLLSMFSRSEIDEILMRELREANKINPVDCSDYINEDKSWFIETLMKEEK